MGFHSRLEEMLLGWRPFPVCRTASTWLEAVSVRFPLTLLRVAAEDFHHGLPVVVEVVADIFRLGQILQSA